MASQPGNAASRAIRNREDWFNPRAFDNLLNSTALQNSPTRYENGTFSFRAPNTIDPRYFELYANYIF